MYLDQIRRSLNAVLYSINQAWKWICSSDASNLGSILSGIGTLWLVILAHRWVSQKRVEKMSNVAEYALNHLYVFLDEIKNWLKYADNFIVYSRFSEKNIAELAALSEKEQKELIDQFNNDKYEVHNYCKSGVEITKVLHAVSHHAKRLLDPSIDEKLKNLTKYAQELPKQLLNSHFLPSPAESKEKSRDYIHDASSKINAYCSEIDQLLMNYLMFRKKHKPTS